MIFIIGAGLFLAGVLMLIRFLKLARRPTIDDAIIVAVTHEFYYHKKNPNYPSARPLPHGQIEYYYRSVKYSTKILLKTKKSITATKIKLTVNPENPEEIEHYEPNREMMVIIFLLGIGAVTMIGCVLILNYYDAW